MYIDFAYAFRIIYSQIVSMREIANFVTNRVQKNMPFKYLEFIFKKFYQPLFIMLNVLSRF